jgi:F0F1-type ATP synthase epsilon subunit
MIRKLSTGDVVVFDDKTRDLYVVDSAHAHNIDDQKIKDAVSSAQALVKAGHAKHYDRSALKQLQSSLAGIPLLG